MQMKIIIVAAIAFLLSFGAFLIARMHIDNFYAGLAASVVFFTVFILAGKLIRST